MRLLRDLVPDSRERTVVVEWHRRTAVVSHPRIRAPMPAKGLITIGWWFVAAYATPLVDRLADDLSCGRGTGIGLSRRTRNIAWSSGKALPRRQHQDRKSR